MSSFIGIDLCCGRGHKFLLNLNLDIYAVTRGLNGHQFLGLFLLFESSQAVIQIVCQLENGVE